jgi:hypothetical protein
MSATPYLKINVINKFIQSQPVAGVGHAANAGAATQSVAGVGHASHAGAASQSAGAASQSPRKEAAVEQNSSIKENVGKYNKDAILNKWFSSQTLIC